MKICVACSAGGHLTEMMRLKELFKKYDYYIITLKMKQTEYLKETVYFLEDTGRGPLGFFINTMKSLKIFLKEKPDLVISIGSGIMVPTCYIAKLFRKKVIFLEGFSCVENISTTGKIIYPIADLFLVQWENLVKKYKKAKYWGAVF